MTDDDDRWITSLLHGEADRHEPDRARVMARIRDGLGPPAPVRTRTGGRWLLPLSIAAAALVVMAGVGSFVVARVGPQTGREQVRTPAPVDTGGTQPAASRGKVSVGTPTSAPSTSATTGSTPSGATSRAPVAAGPVIIQAQPAPS